MLKLDPNGSLQSIFAQTVSIKPPPPLQDATHEYLSEMGNLVTEIEELPTQLTSEEDERLQRCFKKVRSKWESFENNATVAVENARTTEAREEIFQFVETTTSFIVTFFVTMDRIFQRVVDLIRAGYMLIKEASVGILNLIYSGFKSLFSRFL
jgi:hypothetical protein